MPKALKAALEEISRGTWKLLRDASALKASIGEETLTDLLAIQAMRWGNRQLHNPITIKQTDKRTEAKRGTDIEIEGWLGSHRQGWFRLAIQAKKIDVHSGKYRKLNYGAKNRRQIDILKQYTDNSDAMPFYLLYNYTASATGAHWQCTRPFKEMQLGCTIAPLSVIEEAIRLRHGFNEVHRNKCTIPLRCLASCSHLCLPRGSVPRRLPEFLQDDRLYVTSDDFRTSLTDGKPDYSDEIGLPNQVWVFDSSVVDIGPNRREE